MNRQRKLCGGLYNCTICSMTQEEMDDTGRCERARYEAAQKMREAEEYAAKVLTDLTEDVVNHPSHYTSSPSGVECIQITEHMGFNLGCALKYIWRADLKNNATEDMRKAIFYLKRELARRL